MHRFYCPDADLKKKFLVISDKHEIHHLRDVLRLKKNNLLNVFSGSGEEATCRILQISSQEVKTQIEAVKKVARKKKASIILACAIPKKAKFELIIEKCTELGVDEIIPLKTKRTEVTFDKEKTKKKNLRFQNVAVNASKQCKRSDIPKIHNVTDFEKLIKSLDESYAAFIPCLMGDRKSLPQAYKIQPDKKKVIFFIGPEGDFTQEELDLAIKFGCIPVTLGENVLKVDTAAISVIALANLLI